MDWTPIIIGVIIVTGSFIAVSYDYVASKNNFGVGEFFQRKGPIHFIGGIIGMGTLSYIAFFSEWWVVLIAAVTAWIGSQMLITLFRTGAQILSLLLMFGGIVYLILQL